MLVADIGSVLEQTAQCDADLAKGLVGHEGQVVRTRDGAGCRVDHRHLQHYGKSRRQAEDVPLLDAGPSIDLAAEVGDKIDAVFAEFAHQFVQRGRDVTEPPHVLRRDRVGRHDDAAGGDGPVTLGRVRLSDDDGMPFAGLDETDEVGLVGRHLGENRRRQDDLEGYSGEIGIERASGLVQFAHSG